MYCVIDYVPLTPSLDPDRCRRSIFQPTLVLFFAIKLFKNQPILPLNIDKSFWEVLGVALADWVSNLLTRRSNNIPIRKKSVPHPLAEAASQLEAWAVQRTLIWISPPFEKRYYQSMILDVDLPSETFLTDELFPYGGGSELLVNQHLSVEVRGKAQHASFKCLCIGEQPDYKGTSMANKAPLIMRIPQVISQHQRRAGFRVDLAYVNEAFLTLQLPGRDTDDMFPLLDISSAGVAIAVPESVAASFPECVEGALVTVLDVIFEVTLTRRRTHALHNGRHLVGLAFCNIMPAQQAKLERWILQLQRQLRRRLQNCYAA